MKMSLQPLLSFALLMLLLAGCSGAAPTQIPVGLSATPNPPIDFPATVAPSASPTETFTPFPTEPPVLPVAAGSPVPQPSEVISPENVDRILEIANWSGHGCSVFSLTFSPDSQMLASTSCDQTLRLWDLATGQSRTIGQPGVEFGTEFSQDGNLLAAWSNDKTIIVYDVISGDILHSLEDTASMYDAAFSPDGGTLAAASADGTVRMWDLASGGELPSLSADLGEQYGSLLRVYNVDFSPDGTTLASVDEDNRVRLWDLASGSVLRRIEVQDARSAYFSMDGRMLLVWTARSYNNASDYETIAKLFDVASGSRLRNFSGDPDKGGDTALSPDGSVLIVGLEDGTIVLYEVASGSELRRLTGHTDRVDSVAFSPDGRFIASGSADGDRTIKLWGIYP